MRNIKIQTQNQPLDLDRMIDRPLHRRVFAIKVADCICHFVSNNFFLSSRIDRPFG